MVKIFLLHKRENSFCGNNSEAEVACLLLFVEVNNVMLVVVSVAASNASLSSGSSHWSL